MRLTEGLSTAVLNEMCSRYVNVGLFYLRQLFFANFDLKVHTDKGKSSLGYTLPLSY